MDKISRNGNDQNQEFFILKWLHYHNEIIKHVINNYNRMIENDYRSYGLW